MTLPNSQTELTIRTIAMPSDTNPAGDIFGGWVMSQMDLAAFLRSSEYSKGRTVTAAVKEMAFQKPVKVGDTVFIYTKLTRVGRTSMELFIEVWTGRAGNEQVKVTEASFVMVAVDEAGQPRPVSL